MKNTIAIDFGTMRTKLSYFNPTAKTVELMRLGDDERTYIPSIFYLSKDGRRLFGDEAADFLDSDPLGFLNKPLKRQIREHNVRAGNREKASPSELLSFLFSGLRQRTKELACFKDSLPNGLILTVPAQESELYREILTDAAIQAGFASDLITFVVEPIAAAQAWLSTVDRNDEHVIVLDCGGGTLDWACLRWNSHNNRFEIMPELPPGGDNKLGGYDIDEGLYVYALENIQDDATREDFINHRSLYQDQLRKIKEKYSRTGEGGKLRVNDTIIEIPPHLIENIAQASFVFPASKNFVSYLEKARVELKTDKPTVLLVGGSSRLRGFARYLEEEHKCTAIWWERSEYATVLGAFDPPTPTKRRLYDKMFSKIGYKVVQNDEIESWAFCTETTERSLGDAARKWHESFPVLTLESH